MVITLEEVILEKFDEISDELRSFIRNQFEVSLKDDQDDVLEFINDIETQGFEFVLELRDENRDLYIINLKRNGMTYDSLEVTIYGLI